MRIETSKAKQAKFTTALLVGVFVVMILPILNGGPAIYFDTPAYLEPAFKVGRLLFSPDSNTEAAVSLPERRVAFESPQSDKVVTSGRSLYYGLFLYLGWETSLWIPVFIQAGVLSWLVLLLFKLASPPAWPYKAIATLCLISIFGSASFFAGLLMPDIWVGIMILTLALLWTYDHQLSKWSKLTMLALLVFSAIAHSSHFVLLAAITFLFMIPWMLRPGRNEPFTQKFAIPAIALVLGVAGMVAYGLAVKVVYSAKLLHRPFLTAHLTDIGPGTSYLKHSCPESGFVLCEYQDRLPVDWIDFLFDESPEKGIFASAPKEIQLAIADEQMAFALQTLAAEPVSTISGLINDGLSQLWTLSITDVALTQRNEAFLLEHAQPGLVKEIEETRVYNAPDLTFAIERNIEVLTVLSALVLGTWLILRLRRSVPTDPKTAAVDSVVTILIAGVVLNALICGILASPLGRFQARIVWLLPLIALLILSSWPIALVRPKWLPRIGSS